MIAKLMLTNVKYKYIHNRKGRCRGTILWFLVVFDCKEVFLCTSWLISIPDQTPIDQVV